MIYDVLIKSTEPGGHTITQENTSKQLADLGIHQRRWLSGGSSISSPSSHRWRVFVDDTAIATMLILKCEEVNTDYYSGLKSRLIAVELKYKQDKADLLEALSGEQFKTLPRQNT